MAGLGGTPVALMKNPRDQPGPLPNVLGRRSTGHAIEHVAGMSEPGSLGRPPVYCPRPKGELRLAKHCTQP